MPTRSFTSVVFLLALNNFLCFISCLNSELALTGTTLGISLRVSSRFADNAELNHVHEKSSKSENRSAQLLENDRGIDQKLTNVLYELPPSRSYGVIDKLFSPSNSFITKFKLQVETTSETSKKNSLALNKRNNTIETSTESNRPLLSSIIEDFDKPYRNINRSSISIEFKKKLSIARSEVNFDENEKNSAFTRSLEQLQNYSLSSLPSLEPKFNPTSTTSSTILTSRMFSRRISLDLESPHPIPTKSSYGPPQQSNQFSLFTKSYGPPYRNIISTNNVHPGQSSWLTSSQLPNPYQNHYRAPETFYGLPPKTSNTDVSQLSQQHEISLVSLTYGPSDRLLPPHPVEIRQFTNSFHKQRPSEEFLPPSVDLTALGSGHLFPPVNIYGNIHNLNYNRPLNSYESPILGYSFNKYH